MSRPARSSDRILAVLGLVATSPLLAAAALGIKFSDSGPVLYRARRAGRDGVSFTMYKFRTMREGDAEFGAGRITGGADPRVFAWGRWLRSAKIDELPQLVNVARGEMAIVGPRPEDPFIVQEEYAEWMLETLDVLPGLTSPGSLEYFAEEASLPSDPIAAERIYLRELLPLKLATDLVYVRNHSARYDAFLVLRTIASVLGFRRAFRRSRAREAVEARRILAAVAAS